MTNYFKTIVDLETNERVEILLVGDELKERQAADAAAQAETQALAAETEAKEAARQALLDKLGITADEAKLLLG
jgi:hypothetical protein